MEIALVPLVSPVHDEEIIDDTLRDFMKELEEFNFQEVSINQLDKLENYDLTLIYVKSGGTENIFKGIYEKLPDPVFILSTDLHNSLAASMEILSFIKDRRGGGEIIHGAPEIVKKRIREVLLFSLTRKRLNSTKIGVIGEPSDWLIGSMVDYNRVKDIMGCDVISISIQELISLYEEVDIKRAQRLAHDFGSKARSWVENDGEDIIQASCVYLALKKIVNRYKLNAITLRCFDLLDSLETTGCLALSWLNNEGIISGCEGDLPTTISMLLVYYLTGQLSFMSNPVSIEHNNNTVNFAHCTIATDMIKEYTIRSHFESGIGAAIQGELVEGPVTLFKLGGKKLDKYVIKEGRILENLNNCGSCRTQIKVKIFTNLDYFLNNPIGNHHLIIPGQHSKELSNYFRLSSNYWFPCY